MILLLEIFKITQVLFQNNYKRVAKIFYNTQLYKQQNKSIEGTAYSLNWEQ